MKSIKSILILALVISLLTGCGNNVSNGSASSESSGESFDETVEPGAFDTSATIDEQVIYDQGGIKITATSLEYESSRAELFFLVENNNDVAYTVTTGSMGYSCNEINGWMNPDGWFSEDVAAGKKVNTHCYFDFDYLQLCGINQIGVIQMGFDIARSDSWDSTYTGPLEIRTSAYDVWKNDEMTAAKAASVYKYYSGFLADEIQKLSDEPVYDNKGIVIKPWLYCDDGETKYLILNVENTASEQIDLCMSDMGVNGYTLSSGLWSGDLINGNSKALIYTDISNLGEEEDWKVYNIDTVNDIEITIYLEDTEGNEISARKELSIPITADAGTRETDESGTVLYNDHGVTITDKGVYEDKYGSHINWKLLIRNDNKYSIYVSDNSGSMSIGDYMVDALMFGADIGPGQTAIATVEVYKDALESSGIDPQTLGEAEITLKILNWDDYDQIDEPTIRTQLEIKE